MDDKWDGSGSISEPCPIESCRWFGEYHRYSLHRPDDETERHRCERPDCNCLKSSHV